MMKLEFDKSVAEGYKSPAQRARVLTEDWGARNLYCPACDAGELKQLSDNTRIFDFECVQCNQKYQFKSQNKPFGNRIMDSAYQPMIESIQENRTPHLFVLNYNPLTLCAQNLLIIPKFFLTLSYIEKKTPFNHSLYCCNII